MGSSKSKDDKVDIYLELDKLYYQAGSQLTGNVYVNCHENRNYDALYIRL